ncbi:MAG: FAD-dependent pyridine nucleotide-disulfide oxidoreductase, partial [Verrucomicrobia bacterium]|nr:FAD-dependent pyridine nucleotide-disulfide oxidoreductase [Verrucomicrobiota bacterium]
MLDVAIIGGGPAGLSAALVLGRCQRRVLVIDSGRPRNGASRGLHGFLTRDGINPHELRRLGREQLHSYSTVKLRDQKVADVKRHDGRFTLLLEDGHQVEARFVLFSTGREDVLPEQPGFREFFGRGVYHCPHCDGWEH